MLRAVLRQRPRFGAVARTAVLRRVPALSMASSASRPAPRRTFVTARPLHSASAASAAPSGSSSSPVPVPAPVRRELRSRMFARFDLQYKAPSASLQWLVRAGFVEPLMRAGLFAYYPLARRVLDKIEAIIHDELQAIGCVNFEMSRVLPLELLAQSGRLPCMGSELFRLENPHAASSATTNAGDSGVIDDASINTAHGMYLAPTHEEAYTWYVGNKWQRTGRFYQIAEKFRNEERPHSGLLRAREFVMKDLYTFDTDERSARHTYAQVRAAYERIFTRIGVRYALASADSGAIGGSLSEEFHIPSPAGEDVLVHCAACRTCANKEKAASRVPTTPAKPDKLFGTTFDPRRGAPAPDPAAQARVNALVSAAARATGTALDTRALSAAVLVPDTDPARAVLLLLRADRRANPYAVKGRLAAAEVQLLPASAANQLLAARALDAAAAGAADGLPPALPILADDSLFAGSSAPPASSSAVLRGDFHYATNGDSCPTCSGPLTTEPGIEVGHVFYLGTKYSAPMNARVRASNAPAPAPAPAAKAAKGAGAGAAAAASVATSKDVVADMGCYGIGVSRMLAAIVEARHDAHGMSWPFAVAPYRVVIIPIPPKHSKAVTATAAASAADVAAAAAAAKAIEAAALALYDRLQAVPSLRGQVLLDDRMFTPGVTPGERMNEAVMIGYPFQIVVSKPFTTQQLYELQTRNAQTPAAAAATPAAAPAAAPAAKSFGTHKELLSEAQLIDFFGKFSV